MSCRLTLERDELKPRTHRMDAVGFAAGAGGLPRWVEFLRWTGRERRSGRATGS